jgi:glycine hydroxymethyltransferase
VLTNKYAEGYPGKRYYGGCEHVDVAEHAGDRAGEEALRRRVRQRAAALRLAGERRRLQAHAQPGDTILGMSLAHGGHLTHGASVNFSGKIYKGVQLRPRCPTEEIDYDAGGAPGARAPAEDDRRRCLRLLAADRLEALPRDRRRGRRLLLVDMAHYAGLVAAGVYPSPGRHRRLRDDHHAQDAARAARRHHPAEAEHEKPLNSMIFPGIQGGPLMHVIAAKAVAFKEALTGVQDLPEAGRRERPAMARRLTERGLRIVSGRTESHMFLVDLRAKKITGKDAEAVLGRAHITVNKNAIPNDPREAVRDERHPHRLAGHHHARLRELGGREGGGPHRRRARRPRQRHRDASTVERVRALCSVFPVYGPDYRP